MIRKLQKSLTAFFFLLASANVLAQEDESLMTYDLAMQAMGAAEAYARDQGWNVTILITDQNNNPVMLHRIDGAGARTFEFASRKALVVNEIGIASGEYGQQVEAGDREEIEGGVTFAGGVPIFANGERIGAISVSGVTAAQDEEVAIAGAEAIGSASN